MAFQPYFALHFARMLLPYIEPLTLISWAAVFVQLFLVIGVTLRVMLTRHPPGSSFAWILITVILPYFGFILYLLMGERTLGKWHARKLRREMRKRRQIFRHFMHTDAMAPLQWRGLSRLATRLSRCPLTQQSSLALLNDADETLTRLVKDIDNARSCIVMEFYIWDVGGKADDVSAALIRAARRGVKCYVLVDAIGSSKFLSSHWAPMFRHEGIRLESALPVSIFSALLSRVDIRLHRKVVVIDQSIGYSGSLNMADAGSPAVSRNLKYTFAKVARKHGTDILAASDHAKPSSIDCEHLDENGHNALARAVEDKILSIYGRAAS